MGQDTQDIAVRKIGRNVRKLEEIEQGEFGQDFQFVNNVKHNWWSY